MPVSSRVEDYLEALFRLETSGRRLTVTALAEQLSLTKGTIATGVKKMEEAGLVSHAAYGDVFLTPAGREIGWKILVKHEALTVFFCEILNIDPERSEEIACLMEHYLDGKAAGRFFNLIDSLYEACLSQKEWMKELSDALDKPQTPPCPLTLWKAKNGKICRLSGTPKIIAALEKAGIKTGATAENIRFSPEKGEYAFRSDGKTVVLPFAEAATVWLSPLK